MIGLPSPGECSNHPVSEREIDVPFKLLIKYRRTSNAAELISYTSCAARANEVSFKSGSRSSYLHAFGAIVNCEPPESGKTEPESHEFLLRKRKNFPLGN